MPPKGNETIARPEDKLVHLQNCVQDKAKEALMGLEATNENLTVAVDILKARFGDP